MALRISPRWIKTYCEIEASVDELAALLSQTGFETEVVDDVFIDPNIVIGRVVSVNQHLNAEKLNVCEVDVGTQKLTIVCGCKTVLNAKYVIVAQVGCKLSNITIKETDLRGVTSQGMICSLSELGLQETSSGIYHVHEKVDIGTSVVDWLLHDDQLLEIDITPNRGDCLSIYGIARDLAATQDIALRAYPEGAHLATIQDADLFEVKTDGVDAYAAIALTINPDRQIPLYMLNRLRQASIGSNHLVVDILNYIMLEIGQPMHGFNQTSLSLPLIIEEDKKSTCLLLDKTEYQTQKWDLLVSDQKSVVALAGIMGGYDSRMCDGNVLVQLESAVFSPQRIAHSLRRCHLNTDASYRYERGVSLDLNELALSYALKLLQLYADAEVHNKQCYIKSKPRRQITLDPSFVNRYLGIDLELSMMQTYLERLGMEIHENQVTVPYYRHDMTLPVDLVEEIVRLYGYNQIPLTPMQDTLVPKVVYQNPYYSLKQKLSYLGFHEVLQFSFVSQKLLDIFSINIRAIEIENPIHAEHGFMRTHLWQSLIMAAQYNYQRQQNHMKLFELGSVFHMENEISEPLHLAGLMIGDMESGYLSSHELVNYFSMQKIVLQIVDEYKMDVSFIRSNNPALHPNQSSDIIFCGVKIGELGMLHPKAALALGLPEVGLFDIDLQYLEKQALTNAKKPSKFPAVTRDITVSVNKSVSLQSLEEKITSVPYMVSMVLLDIYDLDENIKNITWNIHFQSSTETLSDKMINASMDKINTQLMVSE